MQICSVACTIATCNLDGGDSCDSIRSFGVQNTYSTNFGMLQPQQFVVATQPQNYCECYHDACVYTWDPAGVRSFSSSACFSIDFRASPPTLTVTSRSGGEFDVSGISVTLSDAPLCTSANSCTSCCNQVGQPATKKYIVIRYWNRIPSATVSGSCGNATYGNPNPGSFGYQAWWTEFTLAYCIDVSETGDTCRADLVAIGASTIIPAASYGPDAFLGAGSCDCENNTSNTCNQSGIVLAGCAPFTGTLATVYQLAGSPPMTLYCSRCDCP